MTVCQKVPFLTAEFATAVLGIVFLGVELSFKQDQTVYRMSLSYRMSLFYRMNLSYRMSLSYRMNLSYRMSLRKFFMRYVLYEVCSLGDTFFRRYDL